mmetsp:Transcript_13493/g.33080  ORF Transcript_13493/g.33080 Transcript_13493/m.33080 type:complete len:457 (-) Transcript_13493:353-1723(-)|eukprot:CAMPEP_0114502116 /NCGR_PEP_ID=MMETSP0109-20121206/8870_1 /TAXON_ID=29199 /ORGANISM="Chlorarachnion reptans, Strain CCCM449" /LENGTH=456 /DNA_ID=CAMNT_0001679911 /DNA_START=220 /DNA_END=1590 /DNA_ORIENTATION=+
MCKTVGKSDSSPRIFSVHSKQEVNLHKSPGNLWVVIDGKVYDVSNFVDKHPGGLVPLMHTAGKDASVVFNNFHPKHVRKMLAPMCVGTIDVPADPNSFAQKYEVLRDQMKEAGLFKFNPTYYRWMAVRVGLIFSLFVGLTFFGRDVYWQLAGAVALGMFWQQAMLFGHDLCHNSVLPIKQVQKLAFIAVGTVGISRSWWTYSHNSHHIVTNALEHDADIQHLPFFAVDRGYFKSIYSTWHKRVLEFDIWSRFMVRYQHILFYPVMTVARVYLYVQSLGFLLMGKNLVTRFSELLGMLAFFAWTWFACSQLPSLQTQILYFYISHAVAGILHVQICISHFPMKIYENMELENDSENYFRTQLETTMDVSCPWYMEWFHGGLQYQIEHHLFPLIPRHNLKKCKELVEIFCKQNGIEHKSVSFYEANRMVLLRLHNVAKESVQMKFGDSVICDLLNARG